MPHYWQDAIAYLSQRDERLAGLIQRFDGVVLQSKGDAFLTLIRAVVGQQISVKAADSVWQKVMAEFGDGLCYQAVKNSDISRLRRCGLSAQKVRYLHNIALYFATHNIDEDYWQKYDYNRIYTSLMTIKGVGRWTVEMFAIFYLLEPDILPQQDLGLMRGIEKLYSQENQPISQQQIDKITDQWKPYRTVATWYLWRSIDDDVVTY